MSLNSPEIESRTKVGNAKAIMLAALVMGSPAPAAPAQQFAESAKCTRAKAVDGDTLRCGNLGPVRLLSIDAPEMPGHCRAGRVCTLGDGRAAKRHLAKLIGGKAVHCTATGRDRYDRLLARCSAAGRDLSCAMVDSGHAVVRYGRLNCH